jgi:RNA 2',3'-cyclic 3'-phosphodiesterase
MSAKTHTTAVVLIPPAGVWPPIQAIRQQHDRNVRRWMPHITLLYPFAPRSSFADTAPLLKEACADLAPFTVTLARFGGFTHGRRGATLFLVPEPMEPLVALQTRLWETMPAYDDTRRHANGFTPHLSVGQARSGGEARTLLETLATDWEPTSFTATAASLIWRGEPPDDMFRISSTLPLGSLP